MGPINCRVVKVNFGDCTGVKPNGVYLDTSSGIQKISIEASSGIMVYYDGSASYNFPTHDRCGADHGYDWTALQGYPEVRGTIYVR